MYYLIICESLSYTVFYKEDLIRSTLVNRSLHSSAKICSLEWNEPDSGKIKR